MAKTPYQDLSTQDILSAHISGLQNDMNKIQEILNLDTEQITGHTLNAVSDQEDPALRYRIYEGSIRGWLSDPSPVIYRNGSQVDSNEYEIQEAYGVVVFQEQQNADDNFTADFTHITAQSTTINNINSDIDTNKQDITDIQTDIDNIGKPRNQLVLASGLYASHNMNHFAELSSDTAMASNLLDAFPFPVSEHLSLDYLACKVDIVAGSEGALAIYRDNGNGYPGDLVVDGGTFSTTSTGWKYNGIEVTLEPDLYWLVRNQDGSSAFSGFWYEDVIPIGFKLDEIPDKSAIEDGSAETRNNGFYGGYRGSSSAGLDGGFPETFPSGLEPFSRSAYGSVFVRRA